MSLKPVEVSSTALELSSQLEELWRTIFGEKVSILCESHDVYVTHPKNCVSLSLCASLFWSVSWTMIWRGLWAKMLIKMVLGSRMKIDRLFIVQNTEEGGWFSPFLRGTLFWFFLRLLKMK